MITAEIEILKDHASALNRHAAALEEQNKIRAIELKFSSEEKRRERVRYKKWLYADEVVAELRPFVTETQTLKIVREDGKMGMSDEGYKLQGRTYFYNPKVIESLRKQFEAGTLQPIKRK